MLRNGFRYRQGLIIFVVALAIAGLGFVIINEVQNDAVEDQAIKTAESVVGQMLATREVYTRDVVGKLQGDNVPVQFDPDFANNRGFVPLPATMVHLISTEVNKQGLFTIDLISPWAINRAKMPGSPWERDSVEALVMDPVTPQSRIDSGGGGRLQYIAADFASAQACVTCHNAHPDSPKQDYQLGDMMGALVVTVPLGDELSDARMDAVYIALGNIGVLAILAVGLVLVLRRLA